jgi:DNA integrity scanning protein DisA with diadenylate cyclase activity
MSGLHDPRSLMGKLMRAQDDTARKGAMNDLEEAVIQLATRKTGAIIMPEQLTPEPATAA